MLPLQRYNQDLQSGLITRDPEQERILGLMQRLHNEVVTADVRSANPLSRILHWFQGGTRPTQSGKGIYLWGGVGRGKTYLMDLFYDCLPEGRKQRTHFYRFMQSVHGSLSKMQGSADPLRRVAQEIGNEIDVLCFDEFFVSDIGDAMILSGLLDALFANGVLLVATSNIPPDLLYENGLQREKFLPAIELLKRHTEVIEMEAGVDYRLRSLSGSELYLHPMDSDALGKLEKHFSALAPDHLNIQENQSVEILRREIIARYCADDVAWFEFVELCDGPRSAFDYVEIAKLFHAIILSNVPALDDGSSEQARRFVSLVDELYDRKVKLIIGAEVPLEEIYSGSSLEFEMQRTRSRLTEMQSHGFLASGHQA
ncbi:MAG: cell division protein ZapE [Gammaproteobacteria bacterium]